MSHDLRHAYDALHALLAVAALVLVGLTLYNYTQSGELGWSSIGIAVILFIIIALQRASRQKRGDGGGRT